MDHTVAVPDGRSYPQVAATLGPTRTADWLCRSQEIDEVAVRADAHGGRLGWRQVGQPAPGGSDVAVFLGPGHPADLTACPASS
ncbi:hypothetical protein [Streptomyces kanamyceticus]|uniref:Uncharacterized protein n=1 Tax=Streptomyces kanamyceticus TaxID=1967 RepID=A0A5J6GRG1_STRKN|nr:hypothetical protein [Streptomyces kanamyceticus]QEU96771.1 hypothetical protein CP970_42750 [Streptomyces kanamyceticus]